MEDFLSMKEAAIVLDVTYITCMNYVRTGKIRGAFKRGGQWKIPRCELERFMTQGNPSRGEKHNEDSVPPIRRNGQHYTIN